VFETSVTGGSITHFIWNIFCEIILETNNFEIWLELKENNCKVINFLLNLKIF
jgi:phage FluMu protein Com